jgi:hypothetical protein
MVNYGRVGKYNMRKSKRYLFSKGSANKYPWQDCYSTPPHGEITTAADIGEGEGDG